MTAAEIIEAIVAEGGQLALEGEDRIRFKRLPRRLVQTLRTHKPDVVRELLQRRRVVGIAPSAEDAVAEAARLLREGRWLAEASPCKFFIGHAWEPLCRRCGASQKSHRDV